jgi:hypothetical protein
MTPETKSMLFSFYNRRNDPHHIADHGPWIICHNETGDCAAIPLEPEKGYLPSHFGGMAYVQQLAHQGRLTLKPEILNH